MTPTRTATVAARPASFWPAVDSVALHFSIWSFQYIISIFSTKFVNSEFLPSIIFTVIRSEEIRPSDRRENLHAPLEKYSRDICGLGLGNVTLLR